MKLILDINDNKVSFFMEIIKYFPFVREVKPISDAKAELMQDIKEVVENLNMVKAGKLEARPIKELLDEL